MARGFYPSVEGVARKGTQIYGGVDGIARKVVKAYAGVGGVAQQMWPRCTWQRYSIAELTTYYWDKYSADSTTHYTGEVTVNKVSTASMTVDWRDLCVANTDPPRVAYVDHILFGSSWDALSNRAWRYVKAGMWIGQGTVLSNPRYQLISAPSQTSPHEFSYSAIATADTETVFAKGTDSLGQVSSTDPSAFPADGASDGFWYTATEETTTEQIPGELIDTVTGNDGDYPDNGILGDYWYVRVE